MLRYLSPKEWVAKRELMSLSRLLDMQDRLIAAYAADVNDTIPLGAYGMDEDGTIWISPPEN